MRSFLTDPPHKYTHTIVPRTLGSGDTAVQLCRVLGRGGFATVFAARYRGESCCIKVPRAGSTTTTVDHINMFQKEVTVLRAFLDPLDLERGGCKHLPTLTISNWLCDEASLWITTREIGVNLPRCAASLAIEQRRKLWTVLEAQLTDALTYAHNKDVCHTDVRPPNIVIMCLHESGRERALLIDWGLAVTDKQPLKKALRGDRNYFASQLLLAGPDGIPFDPAFDYESLTYVGFTFVKVKSVKLVPPWGTKLLPPKLLVAERTKLTAEVPW